MHSFAEWPQVRDKKTILEAFMSDRLNKSSVNATCQRDDDLLITNTVITENNTSNFNN